MPNGHDLELESRAVLAHEGVLGWRINELLCLSGLKRRLLHGLDTLIIVLELINQIFSNHEDRPGVLFNLQAFFRVKHSDSFHFMLERKDFVETIDLNVLIINL